MTSKYLTLLFTLGALAVPAHATTITLTALSSPSAGSAFDVSVKLTGVFSTHPGDAISAFGFDVIANPAYSFTGETIGSLFDDFSSIFGASPQVTGLASSGFLAAGDFTEPLTLATLHFLAISPGVKTVAIKTDLSDPNQGLFYLTAGADPLNASGSVTIVQGTPEPSTVVLGGLALGSLFFMRSHKRRT